MQLTERLRCQEFLALGISTKRQWVDIHFHPKPVSRRLCLLLGIEGANNYAIPDTTAGHFNAHRACWEAEQQNSCTSGLGRVGAAKRTCL